MCQNIGIQATVNKLKQVMQRFFVYSLRFTLTPTNKKQVFSGNIVWLQFIDQLQQSSWNWREYCWDAEIKFKTIMCISLFLFLKKKKLYFATDNTDLKTDTRDGKNQLQGQLLWHIKMKPTKRSSLTLLLCKTQFIKLNTVSLQTVLMQNVKIMFHFVQLIKSNFILQMIQSGMY